MEMCASGAKGEKKAPFVTIKNFYSQFETGDEEKAELKEKAKCDL